MARLGCAGPEEGVRQVQSGSCEEGLERSSGEPGGGCPGGLRAGQADTLAVDSRLGAFVAEVGRQSGLSEMKP